MMSLTHRLSHTRRASALARMILAGLCGTLITLRLSGGSAETSEPPEAASEAEAIKAFKANNQSKFDSLETRFEDFDGQLEELELTLLESQELEETDTGIEIYGFFDVLFLKAFSKKGSLLEGLAWPSSTFILQNLNLYFAGQMTRTLSSIVELRFTFRPLGDERQFEFSQLGLAYDRLDTEVDDQLSNEHFRLGGVVIERAHVTWEPIDFFNLIAGYYLTPYGIWNVEHGSPVRLSIRPPYMQISHVVPLAQLGVMAYGRFFPAARTYLDYVVTVSNGRGPMDTIMDLDENKAVGLKLKLSYNGNDVKLAAGGYGYIGDYTDIKRAVTSVFPSFGVRQEVTENYTEYLGAFDFLLRAYGWRLQAEYVWRLTRYSLRPPRDQMHGPGYQPDYLSIFGYGLLAYTLPLERWLDQKTITTFVSLEYSNLDETVDLNTTLMPILGINFKPSEYVALKLEAAYIHTIHDDSFRSWILTAQLAVAF